MTRLRASVGVLLAFLALVAWWGDQGGALPLGIHTLRPDDADLRRVQVLRAEYLVQVFAWREIEPTQGEFHWEYTDWLLRAADYYGVRVIARLDQPPLWATSSSGENPIRTDEYASFVGKVAARYRGRIGAYIIWNEPNLAAEWMGHAPDPVAYAAMLRSAAVSIRATDAHAHVVSAGLAPTNEHSASALDDRDYLRGMYTAGARGAFDILAAHPYAFGYPPDDPHGAHGGLNLYRLLDLRGIMSDYGDAAKPIWITEFGYPTETPSAKVSLHVTESDQARFIARAYDLVRGEMPFVKLFTVWNLTRQLVSDDEQAGYSLVHSDGSPKPAFGAVAALRHEPPGAELAARFSALFHSSAPATSFRVLTRDAVVHLGDDEYPPPWVPLYGDRNPSTEWNGEFYLRESDLHAATPARPWGLTMELMHVNDLDSRLLVNNKPVTPPYLPTEDFTDIWVSAQFQVPVGALRVGLNTITLRDGKLFPAFQQPGFTWDDLQVRDVVVTAPR